MNLFDLLNPRMFRPLTGRNQRIYADLLMLIWDRCSTSQDYSIGKGALTELAETYMEGLGTILPLDERIPRRISHGCQEPRIAVCAPFTGRRVGGRSGGRI